MLYLRGENLTSHMSQMNKQIQASRNGKSAITIYVKPDSKEAIRACLIKGGYGWSFQEGVTKLLQELLKRSGFDDTSVI